MGNNYRGSNAPRFKKCKVLRELGFNPVAKPSPAWDVLVGYTLPVDDHPSIAEPGKPTIVKKRIMLFERPILGKTIDVAFL